MAAALSFYVTLAFAPLTLIFFFLSGAIHTDLAEELSEQLALLAGPGAETLFLAVRTYALAHPHKFLASGVAGSVALAFTASLVFSELRADLNSIFSVPTPESDQPLPGQILTFARQKIAHVGLVLSFIVLVIASLIVSSVLNALGEAIGVSWVITLLTCCVAFAAMLRFIPDKGRPWKVCWAGGLMIGALFTVGKEMIGLYVGRSALFSAYGGSGAAIVFLVWIYYSSSIILFGATLTAELFPKQRERLKA